MSRLAALIAVVFFSWYGAAFAVDEATVNASLNALVAAPSGAGAAPAAPATCILSNDTGDNQSYMPFPAPLKRGINISHWWDAPEEAPPTADDIRQIRDMGFDFVRLSIDPTWMELKDQDLKKKKLAQLRCDIISLLNQRLTVILDLHPNAEFQADIAQRPDDIAFRLEKDWEALEPMLEGLPVWRIYLELCSEPMMDSVQWWKLQGKIIQDLRFGFPNFAFIASPGPFDGWWDMIDRTPYKDSNVVYGFYFFEPRFFTHHGLNSGTDSSGPPSKPPAPIVYPVDRLFNFDLKDPDTSKYVAQGWNQAAIRSVVQNITAWRDHYNTDIVCLEFGVYKPTVDVRSRNNWLEDVHKTFDDFNIPWALWEFRGDFGLVDQQGVPDKSMMDALALKGSEGH